MEYTEFPVSFGEWLKLRRKALDLTQAELAQRAGCSVHALRKIESGERRPSKQLAGLLANSLEIPPEEHTTFVKVARGELIVERLHPPTPAQPADHAPTPSPPAHLNKLPETLPPLVGRDPELETLGGLLRDRKCRLLTLIGPGGIGKTRLGIEVAAQHQNLFPDGVCFVSLASLRTHTYLVPAIADALDYAFQGQIEPQIQLLNHLSTKQMLLVLDNAEHLLVGVELFAEILEQSPGVKLLVTSRERLYLQSEWVFEIQGLPVPPAEQIEHAEQYSSIALFVQCAQRAKVGFKLPAEERSAVVHICQMVEGMPLGIELAAAWVSVLSCDEIAHEIESGLDFLSTSMRDVPERLRSLQAAFDHSWKLLSGDERKVLCRLSIFQGGFEREAAEKVGGATLQSLLALTSKSLIRRIDSSRYDLHEVIQQYALSHLGEDPQIELVRDRHSEFYLSMLREREKALKGAALQEAMRELTDEIDNLREAWSWAVKREAYESLGEVTRSFGRFYELGGWLREGIEQFEPVVEVLNRRTEDGQCQKLLGMVLAQQGLLFFRWGKFDIALSLFEKSLNLLRPIGDPAMLTDPLVLRGIILHLNGDIDQSLSLMEEALNCSRTAGDQWYEAYAVYNQGYIASLLGNYTEGYKLMQAGLAIWRELGEPQATALGLNFITPTLLYFGLYEQAHSGLQESLKLCDQAGNRWGKGTAYRFLGLVNMTQGNFSEAQSQLNKSLELFTEFTVGWDIVQSLIYLGEAATLTGETSNAQELFLDALHQAMEAKTIPLLIDSIIGLANLQIKAGKAEKGLKLASYAQQHPAATKVSKDRADQLVNKSEEELTVMEINSVKEWIQTQSLESLLEETLGEEFAPPSH
jgi:predicted ATPase/transcriptional regulator with XRE-family HTH domain